jgi:hypothetical protein
MMPSRRLNLSSTQVAAGVLATLTGAIAASYLGVGGTLVGAAVGSLASTVGGEVYRHYLGRTQERLRGAVVSRRSRAAGRTVFGNADTAAAQNQVGVTSRRQVGPPDAAQTEVLHLRQPGEVTRPPGRGPRPTVPGDPVQDSPTETFAAGNGWSRGGAAAKSAAPQAGAASGSAASGNTASGSAASGNTASGNTASGSGGAASGGRGSKGGRAWAGRPRWLVLTGIAVVTFLIAVVAITVFELSVGKPLNAVVWHRNGGGTTVGHVIGGQNSGPSPASTPTTSSSVQPTPSGSSATSVAPTPSASPTSLGATPGSATPSPGGPANTAPATASP